MSYLQWQSAFYRSILDTSLAPHLGDFVAQFKAWEGRQNIKELARFSKQIEQLPPVPDDIKVSIGSKVDIQSQLYLGSSEDVAKTRGVLKQFMPWRKGPFSLFGVDIDTEWRSDWKWNRILPHIGDLSGQRVLDVGCGSGYHLFRMHNEGASSVIGIDPTTLFFFQFHCFKRYLSDLAIHFLPIGIEHMPETKAFDSVFSMGVLYHRPDPIKFLRELRQQLKTGGQLVLETLVTEGNENTVLMPHDRYAQMRNVWFIPSVPALSLWLHRVGFKHVECVDLDITSVKEQRATEWMQSQSLVDFLDPNDASKTLEGYKAPMRATIIAK